MLDQNVFGAVHCHYSLFEIKSGKEFAWLQRQIGKKSNLSNTNQTTSFLQKPQEQFTQVRFGGDAPPDLEQTRVELSLAFQI